MMIESLNALHATLVASGVLPPSGYQRVKLRYVIELSEQGSCVAVTDYSGGPADGGWFTVPLAVRRGSAITPNLLWDDCEYALGVPRPGARSEFHRRATAQRHQAFLDQIWSFALTVDNDPGLDAILRFYSEGSYRDWAGALTGGNTATSFRLQGDRSLVAERAELRKAICASYVESSPGGPASVQKGANRRPRVHSLLRGLPGGDCSAVHGEPFILGSDREHASAPRVTDDIAVRPSAAHISAVDWLLRLSCRKPLKFGRLTLLCWQENAIWPEAPELVAAILYGGAKQSREPEPVTISTLGDISLLGLLGHGPRASAVFYRRQSSAGLLHSVARWFSDLEFDCADGPAKGPPGITELIETVTTAGDENGHHQTQMAIALLHAAVFGERVWDDILTEAVRRLRRSGPEKELRLAASLIKLALLRNHGLSLSPGLDVGQRNAAYRLGRLFAVLECLQTIAGTRQLRPTRDHFWTVSLTRPSLGLRVPLRTATVHLRVLLPGKRSFFQSLITDLTDGMGEGGAPARLSPIEQGLLAIGYLHQMTALFEFTCHHRDSLREVQTTRPLSWSRPALGGHRSQISAPSN
jgi:CRISPR-associated protein Csd1